jgi:hypothetical protein
MLGRSKIYAAAGCQADDLNLNLIVSLPKYILKYTDHIFVIASSHYKVPLSMVIFINPVFHDDRPH